MCVYCSMKVQVFLPLAALAILVAMVEGTFKGDHIFLFVPSKKKKKRTNASESIPILLSTLHEYQS